MAPQPYETMFYELMWQIWSRNAPYPMPWWLQSYFRDWPGDDGGMFGAKETALASNGLYRYWNMVGVKDAHQESLVGQAGEIEPVYERYAVTFFIVADGKLHFPQYAENGSPAPALRQQRQDNYLPVVVTTYQPPLGITVEQRTLSTVVGAQNHAAVLNRLVVRASGPAPRPVSWESPSSRSSRAASSGTANGPVSAGVTAVLPAIPGRRGAAGDEYRRLPGLCVRPRIVRAVRERE